MEAAFARHTGRKEVCANIRFGGMTDRAIVRQGLQVAGRSGKESDAVIALYVELLEGEVARSPSYVVHAGVQAILDRSASLADCAVGLGTGNVRPGARLKLERVGIFDRFSFGGFGCDSE